MDKIVFETKDGNVILNPRSDKFSYFCKFDQLRGIVGNSGGPHYSKANSCYVPAKELLKKNQ